jgi:hypothetical protein
LEDVSNAIGDTPVLILLDELPTYLNLVSKTDPKMMDKTTQFIQRLVAAVSEHEKTMLVVAIAEDVYRAEAGYIRRELSEAVEEHLADTKAHIRRKQTVKAPIEEADAVHILKRRLFTKIDETVAKAVASEYHRMYTGGMSFPEAFKKKDYQDLIEEYYPFHPALVQVLYERVATLDAFQRTRGALRLLNRVVRRIWKVKEGDAYLIGPGHVDLADVEIVNDLTHEIGEGKLRNAVEADVWKTGGGAVAQSLDEETITHWGVPLHRRVANAIFLYSLGSGKVTERGINSDTIAAVIVTPAREDHALKIRDSVLKRLLEGHYIDRKGENFQFLREPNPLRVIDREARNVTDQDIAVVVRETLASLFSDQPDWIHVEIFPSDPSHLEDTTNIKLGILSPQLGHYAKSENEPSVSTVRFLTNADSQGKKLRRYRNSTFVLVPEEPSIKGLENVARKLVAIREIRKDPQSYGIPSDRLEALEEYLSNQEKVINDAVRQTYCIFGFVDKKGNTKFVRMSPNGYSGGRKGKEMFAYHLKEVFKRIVEDSLDPGYVESDVWPGESSSISSEMLFDAFHSKPGSIVTTTEGVFSDTLKRGVEEDAWVIKDGETIYTAENPPKHVRIDSSVIIWKKEAAIEAGILGGVKRKSDEEPSKTPKKRAVGGPADPGCHSFPSALPSRLVSDLAIIAKKYNVATFDKATLMLTGTPVALFQIRNLLKRLESDKDLSFTLDVSSNYYNERVELNISLKTDRKGIADQNTRAALDSLAKISSESFACTLVLEKLWKAQELIEHIQSLDVGEDSGLYKLEVSWPLGGGH